MSRTMVWTFPKPDRALDSLASGMLIRIQGSFIESAILLVPMIKHLFSLTCTCRRYSSFYFAFVERRVSSHSLLYLKGPSDALSSGLSSFKNVAPKSSTRYGRALVGPTDYHEESGNFRVTCRGVVVAEGPCILLQLLQSEQKQICH